MRAARQRDPSPVVRYPCPHPVKTPEGTPRRESSRQDGDKTGLRTHGA